MSQRSAGTRFLGLATAMPAHKGEQRTVSRFMMNVLEASADSPARRDRALEMTRRIYENSGIETRHSVIPDFTRDHPHDFEFFPKRWQLEPFPTTAQRMQLYEKESVDLAARAASEALTAARIAPEDVTHLVISTCTGFFAPGPDILLQRQLGLKPTTQRTMIGFMGCHAGFNAIRTADHIIQADSDAVVLLVAVELCSLHFQKKPIPSLVVANGLFSDGCAALVCGSEKKNRRGLAKLVRTRSHVDDQSLHQMSWRIGNHGFEMHLSPDVPETLGTQAPEFVEGLLDGTRWAKSDIQGWALHPGGKKILHALARSLDLNGSDTTHSFEVLRRYGNMSSSAIFFVLEALFCSRQNTGLSVALGFGPGLTIEGLILEDVR